MCALRAEGYDVSSLWRTTLILVCWAEYILHYWSDGGKSFTCAQRTCTLWTEDTYCITCREVKLFYAGWSVHVLIFCPECAISLCEKWKETRSAQRKTAWVMRASHEIKWELYTHVAFIKVFWLHDMERLVRGYIMFYCNDCLAVCEMII